MLEADTEAFSRLIGLIYDCALDPGRWRAALSALREMLGFANAALTLQELPSGAMRLNVTSGVPTDYASRMLEYGADLVDQWGGEAVLAALPFDEPAVLSKVNPPGTRPTLQIDTRWNGPDRRDWRTLWASDWRAMPAQSPASASAAMRIRGRSAVGR